MIYSVYTNIYSIYAYVMYGIYTYIYREREKVKLILFLMFDIQTSIFERMRI